MGDANHDLLKFKAAIADGDLGMVQDLLGRGVRINPRDNGGMTELHCACLRNQFAVAKLFVEDFGAKVNAKDDTGSTALDYAVKAVWGRHHMGLIQFLIDNGGNVNAPDNQGRTTLHRACFECDLGVIQFLLDRGANINAKDNGEMTPLHIACSYNRLDAVQLLMLRGADLTAMDNNGTTPLHFACQLKSSSNLVWYLVRQYPWLVLSEPGAEQKQAKRRKVE